MQRQNRPGTEMRGEGPKVPEWEVKGSWQIKLPETGQALWIPFLAARPGERVLLPLPSAPTRGSGRRGSTASPGWDSLWVLFLMGRHGNPKAPLAGWVPWWQDAGQPGLSGSRASLGFQTQSSTRSFLPFSFPLPFKPICPPPSQCSRCPKPLFLP